MSKIGVFFGTNSGTTRLMAKKLSKLLGGACEKPLNVNRTQPDDFMRYSALILGTPTYGEGQVPSAALGAENGGWEEFLAQLAERDMTGKTIALYGLGDQIKYTDRFASGLGALHDFFASRGATTVGAWSTDGYEFEASAAVADGKFRGLVIDNTNQPLLTAQRLETWVALIEAPLLAAAGIAAASATSAVAPLAEPK